MRRFRPLALAALLSVALAGGRESNPDARQQATIQAVIKLFDRTPLVALGEVHGVNELHAFFRALVADPGFGRNVNAVVVEFGNARYQAVADAFVLGTRHVPDDELRQIWRNTTQSGLTDVWDAPVYERFFRAVRAANRARPAGQAAMRVVLADPPIDWTRINSTKDYVRFVDRDGFYARTVEREILAKHQRALLIAGLGHVARLSPSNFNPSGTAIEQIQRRYPGSVTVLMPYLGFPRHLQEKARQLEQMPAPQLIMTHSTWLGKLSAAEVLEGPPEAPLNMSEGLGQRLLQTVVDGVLVLGRPSTFTISIPDPALYKNPRYAAEVLRRRQIFKEIMDMRGDFLTAKPASSILYFEQH
ncbi:hypothetical protein [Deinococcus sp.]|uniref:hypothetical protein n=1 Tax=Deinococcus sp. TaxID=47478 RepID=UPI0025FF4FC2|nr:hypothetical protein [Deinococcus sp.]